LFLERGSRLSHYDKGDIEGIIKEEPAQKRGIKAGVTNKSQNSAAIKEAV